MVPAQAAALLAAQRRAWRAILNLPRVADLAMTTRVGTTPRDVVFQKHTMRLLHYRRETPPLYDEPVLFCYALINRPYILDLQPGKSVIERYLEHGFDVYMIDWGVPSAADRSLTLETYVCDLLRSAVEFILDRRGLEKLHLVGYCMGGTLATLFTALRPHTVKTLTLLATPIDFSGRESLLNVWAAREHFDVDAFIDTHGNCPAWFLQACFLSTKPVQNVLEKNLAFFEQLDEPRFLTSFFAMERWINDNIPVAGETFREFVKKLYQANELVRGELRLGERPVELGRITCPVLVLTAKNDHLVPPPSTEGILPHLGSRDVRSLAVDAGHVGLVVGGKAHKVLWPAAAHWLSERSTRRDTNPLAHEPAERPAN